MDHLAGQPLTGGFLTSSVTRSGTTVRRTAGPWSPAVQAWLAHLARAGAGVAPRPVRLVEAAGIGGDLHRGDSPQRRRVTGVPVA